MGLFSKGKSIDPTREPRTQPCTDPSSIDARMRASHAHQNAAARARAKGADSVARSHMSAARKTEQDNNGWW